MRHKKTIIKKTIDAFMQIKTSKKLYSLLTNFIFILLIVLTILLTSVFILKSFTPMYATTMTLYDSIQPTVQAGAELSSTQQEKVFAAGKIMSTMLWQLVFTIITSILLLSIFKTLKDLIIVKQLSKIKISYKRIFTYLSTYFLTIVFTIAIPLFIVFKTFNEKLSLVFIIIMVIFVNFVNNNINLLYIIDKKSIKTLWKKIIAHTSLLTIISNVSVLLLLFITFIITAYISTISKITAGIIAILIFSIIMTIKSMIHIKYNTYLLKK